MEVVGIKELKNKLTYYLRLTRQGNKIVVTDRGSPVAIIRSVDEIEENEDVEERLASLAKRGMVRLPAKRGRFKKFKAIQVPGKPASEIIIEERR
jgi:prevent-host-death family protein